MIKIDRQWWSDNYELVIRMLCLVAIVVFVSGYFYARYHRLTGPLVPGPRDKVLTAEEAKLQTEALKEFPATLVLDKKAQESFATTAETPQGLRLTKIFASQLSLAELVKLYQDTLKKTGWTLGRHSADAKTASLTFSKGEAQLGVTITQKDSGSTFALGYYAHLIVPNQSVSPSVSPK